MLKRTKVGLGVVALIILFATLSTETKLFEGAFKVPSKIPQAPKPPPAQLGGASQVQKMPRKGPPPSDTTPPVISYLRVASRHLDTNSTYSIVIQWRTDEITTSRIEYGLTTAYELAPITFSEGVSTGSISNLNENTTYHFRLISTDRAGNVAASDDNIYMIPIRDTASPITSNLSATDITNSSARITWLTNEEATTCVQFSTYSTYYFYTINSLNASNKRTNHDIIIGGSLLPSTTYYYRTCSADNSLNSTYSDSLTFTTLP